MKWDNNNNNHYWDAIYSKLKSQEDCILIGFAENWIWNIENLMGRRQHRWQAWVQCLIKLKRSNSNTWSVMWTMKQ